MIRVKARQHLKWLISALPRLARERIIDAKLKVKHFGSHTEDEIVYLIAEPMDYETNPKAQAAYVPFHIRSIMALPNNDRVVAAEVYRRLEDLAEVWHKGPTEEARV